MSYIFEEVDTQEPPQRIWSAVIASQPADLSTRVSVIIPALDQEQRWENCRWQSRNSTDVPSVGDDCLVMFDDNMEIWVVAWWPF